VRDVDPSRNSRYDGESISLWGDAYCMQLGLQRRQSFFLARNSRIWSHWKLW